jgi:hypothetical protein
MDSPKNTEKRPSLPSINSLDLGQTLTRPLDTRPPPRLAPRPFLPPLVLDGDREVYVEGLLLKEYKVGGKTYTMQRPENEEHSVLQRKTIDDRTLQYELNIIQQPAKARACGAGPRCESLWLLAKRLLTYFSCCRPSSCRSTPSCGPAHLRAYWAR